MEEYRNIISQRKDPLTDWIERREIIGPLLELGTSEAYDLIFNLLINDPNSSVRIKAASKLSYSENPKVTEYLVMALKDWDSGVRLRALVSLNTIEIKNFDKILSILLEIEETENRDNIKNEIRKIFRKQSEKLGKTVLEIKKSKEI